MAKIGKGNAESCVGQTTGHYHTSLLANDHYLEGFSNHLVESYTVGRCGLYWQVARRALGRQGREPRSLFSSIMTCDGNKM